MELTQEYLKSQLNYNQDTGLFTWLVNRGSARHGIIAGTLRNGYIDIRIKGKSYGSHRLAFLYMAGYMPENDTDHINGIKTDNRWENLRAVTRQENMRNARRSKANTSGVTGVHWRADREKWESKIKINGEFVHLGLFKSLTAATIARKMAEKEHMFHKLHGTKKCVDTQEQSHD